MTSSPPPPEDLLCVHCGQKHPATWSHCPNTGRALTVGEALLGRTIAGRYRIVGLLGEGGMGAVYVAEHVLIGRRVAIKRMHPELAQDAGQVARFQREARTAAATGHDHIVDVLDLGYADDGAPYLVMEYLRGESLADKLSRHGRLPPDRACGIAGQVLDALAAVHARNIIHRDLKPDNIFLTRKAGQNDYVKVLDFGISKMKGDGDAGPITRTGVMVGTPQYMSPEQARGMRAHDHRVDIYAVGVILYQMLCGRLPFEGDNYHALLQSILTGTPARPSELVPGLPRDLERAVLRAIDRDPAARFPTARLMLGALVPHGAQDPGDDAADDDSMNGFTAHGAPTAVADPESYEQHAARLAERPSALRDTVAADSFRDTGERLADTGWEVPRPAVRAGAARAFVAQSEDWETPRSERRSRPPPEVPGPAPRMSLVFTRASSLPPERSSEPVPRPGSGASAPPSRAGARPRSEAVSAGAQVKGSLALAALEHLGNQHGPHAVTRVLGRLANADRKRLDGVILPVAWLPFELYEALLSAAEEELGTGDGRVAQAIGLATALRDLPTTHRLLLGDLTPAMALRRLPELYRSYCNQGRPAVHGTGEGPHRVEIQDVPTPSHLHVMAFAGFVRGLVELAGGRAVRVRVLSSMGKGDGRAELSVRWS